MFVHTKHRFKGVDTRQLAAAGGLDSRFALSPFSRLDGADALDHLTLTDAADHALLRLVVCAALATLLLALASSL